MSCCVGSTRDKKNNAKLFSIRVRCELKLHLQYQYILQQLQLHTYNTNTITYLQYNHTYNTITYLQYNYIINDLILIISSPWQYHGLKLHGLQLGTVVRNTINLHIPSHTVSVQRSTGAVL